MNNNDQAKVSNKSGRFIAVSSCLGITLVLLGVAFWLASFGFRPLKQSTNEPKKAQTIEVRRGETPTVISKRVLEVGVIDNERLFYWLGRITRKWGKIKTGEYELTTEMSPIEIFDRITSGVSVAHPITIREGENIYELASELEEKGFGKKEQFLALCRNPEFIKGVSLPEVFHSTKISNLEGFLFPDTYNLNRTMILEDVIRLMVKKFNTVWGKDWSTKAAKLGLNPYEILILASMIEKETGATRERPQISSVFQNRLSKRMRLQSDPTTIYGIFDRYDGNLHKQDLLTPSDYNTYTLPRLPIGPIGNPGKLAMTAALEPAESKALYFVSQNDGTHHFSETYEEHLSAVRKFQLDPKAREGKSWRDLNNKGSNNH